MALIPCPECKESISSEATTCAHCGKPQPGDSRFLCDCGVPNYPNAELCRACGTSLVVVRERIKVNTAVSKALGWSEVGGIVGIVVGVVLGALVSLLFRAGNIATVIIEIVFMAGFWFLGHALPAIWVQIFLRGKGRMD
jgi:hypothetical protein